MDLISEKINNGYVKQYSITLPDWLSVVPTYEEQAQSELISSFITFLFTKGHIQEYLAELDMLSQTKVDFKVFVDFFKIVNFAIANPLNKENFNLEVKALYTIFKDVPLLYFNTQICKELADLAPFFPSAHDVEQLFVKHQKKVTRNMNILQEIIKKN